MCYLFFIFENNIQRRPYSYLTLKSPLMKNVEFIYYINSYNLYLYYIYYTWRATNFFFGTFEVCKLFKKKAGGIGAVLSENLSSPLFWHRGRKSPPRKPGF